MPIDLRNFLAKGKLYCRHRLPRVYRRLGTSLRSRLRRRTHWERSGSNSRSRLRSRRLRDDLGNRRLEQRGVDLPRVPRQRLAPVLTCNRVFKAILCQRKNVEMWVTFKHVWHVRVVQKTRLSNIALLICLYTPCYWQYIMQQGGEKGLYWLVWVFSTSRRRVRSGSRRQILKTHESIKFLFPVVHTLFFITRVISDVFWSFQSFWDFWMRK